MSEANHPTSNPRAKTRQRMLADEELSEYEFDARSHRIALEAHEDRLKLWEDVERLTRELADAVIVIDTQKVQIDGENAERDRERQNWKKEADSLIRAIEGHQRRNAELCGEIERLRAGLEALTLPGRIAVSTSDWARQVLSGDRSPSETYESPLAMFVRSPPEEREKVLERAGERAIEAQRATLKATAFSGTPSSGMGCIVCGRLFFQGQPTCNCNGPQLSQNGDG